MMWLVIILFVIILIIAASCVKIVPQSQAYILERLGVYKATWGSGVHFKVPFIERVAKRVNLKEQVVDFAPQPWLLQKTMLPCGLIRLYSSRLQTQDYLLTALTIRLWRLKI